MVEEFKKWQKDLKPGDKFWVFIPNSGRPFSPDAVQQVEASTCYPPFAECACPHCTGHEEDAPCLGIAHVHFTLGGERKWASPGFAFQRHDQALKIFLRWGKEAFSVRGRANTSALDFREAKLYIAQRDLEVHQCIIKALKKEIRDTERAYKVWLKDMEKKLRE